MGEYLWTASKKAKRPQLPWGVVGSASLGYWHSSTTDIKISGVTNSHPQVGDSILRGPLQ